MVSKESTTCPCLILACGNALRGDDGVGPWLAGWAEERIGADPRVRVKAQTQWTPELAEEIASVGAVIFIDCSMSAPPGAVDISEVHAAPGSRVPGSHHLDAAALLALSRELYGRTPASARILTIGVGSIELGEGFSEPVKAALPDACRALERTVIQVLSAEAS